ncbi:MAG: TRAP transporter small permease [Deltaproteobacteria bacterium]|nr:TRAP transporter small permease [Deltaproteobacteria bacterium]
MSENQVTSAPSPSPLEIRVAFFLRILMYAGTMLVVVMMLLTVIHALGRYFFSSPIPGMVEMSSFLLVVIIFLTGPFTESQKSHIVISIIVDRFSPRVQGILEACINIGSIGVAVLAFWRSVEQGISLYKAGYVTTVLGIHHYPFLFLVGFGWLILGLAILMHLISAYYRVRRAKS